MVLKKKDFIEIEYTGKVVGGEIFDSNITEDLKNSNLSLKAKPFIFCLGEGMFLNSIEDFLIGKSPEKNTYKLTLTPDKAFGNRLSKLIQVIPMRVFIEKKINHYPGALFNFDGRVAKVLSVSGGRVMVDFNNPLAGKTVEYKINLLRQVNDVNEQIKAFIDFLFKKDFDFEIKEKKIIIKVEKQLVDFIKLFSEKFKDIFSMELEVQEIENKGKNTENTKEKLNQENTELTLQ